MAAMCRGCNITIKNRPACFEYVDVIDDFHKIIADMKRAEKALLQFQQSVDDGKQRTIIDRYRKQRIRLRREYAKSDRLLEALGEQT